MNVVRPKYHPVIPDSHAAIAGAFLFVLAVALFASSLLASLVRAVAR